MPCRESEAALKFATAVEAVQATRAELQALHAASSGADWAAVKQEHAATTAKAHELDRRASTLAGELSGLLSVRPFTVLANREHAHAHTCISCDRHVWNGSAVAAQG